MAAGIALTVVFLFAYWTGTFLAERRGFKVGVLHGFMLGRFPEHAYQDQKFKDAAEITDKLEADVAFDPELKG